jgi:curved DNA-binding protein CbpA
MTNANKNDPTREKIENDVNYYAVLGLSHTASADEIKKAYRKMAKKYHPDINKNDEAELMFVKIQKANDILTDAQLKAEFDGIMKAKLFNQQRLEGMNENRKKLREQLEEKERLAKRMKMNNNDDVDFVENKEATVASSKIPKPTNLKKQAEQIRERGGYDALYKRSHEKQKEKQIHAQRAATKPVDVIVKWSKSGVMKDKIVDEQTLKDIFETLFGPTVSVTKIDKKRKAIISFASGLHAQSAAEYWNGNNSTEYHFDVKLAPSIGSDNSILTTPREDKLDYESATLMRIKQKAEEQKKREEMLRKLQKEQQE